MSNEEALKKAADAADKAVKEKHPDPGHGFEFEAGKPLPEGYENPEPGEDYHRCVDLQGNYAPKWSAFNMHRAENHQHRIPFKTGADRYTIETGVWCDVPPHLIKRIRGMVTEVTEMKEIGPIRAGVPARQVTVTHKIQTFHFDSIPSA